MSVDRPSLDRTLGLARFNSMLMMRNRTTLLYALVMPLLPLGLLFVGGRADRTPPSGPQRSAPHS